MNEIQMIKGCTKGDPKAQKKLYDTYSPIMYGVCMRYAKDRDEAKDLLQEGFIKIFSKIAAFERRGSFEGGMKRVFINQALENIRKKKNIHFESESIEDIADLADDTLVDEAEVSEDKLLEMLQSLPDGYATIFNLYAIEDYSHKEIADMLNISEGTSRSQYARARKTLQTMVTNYMNNNS